MEKLSYVVSIIKVSYRSLIRVEVTGHNLTQCKSWGCGKLWTLQITELLAPQLDLLNILT